MEQPTFSKRMLTGKSAINETSDVIGPSQACKVRELRFYANFGPGTTAGTVIVEGAPTENFAGTWASLGSMAWSAASKIETLRVEGVHLAFRARLSVAVTGPGGVVDVDVVGN